MVVVGGFAGKRSERGALGKSLRDCTVSVQLSKIGQLCGVDRLLFRLVLIGWEQVTSCIN